MTMEETQVQTEQKAASDAADKRKARMEAFLAHLPKPCVYCGPSVRGVARQFTVYSAGIPDALKEFIEAHPSARGLLVSTERFARVRVRLETPGTAEYTLFQKVREEL